MTAFRKSSMNSRPADSSRRAFLATMGAVPFLAASPPIAKPARAANALQAEVVVDPAAEQQTIQGFGGMNHSVWISDLTASQRDTAFGDGEGQLGFSVLRIPVHENRSDWSREVATASRAIELGAKVIAAPWNPPSQMVENVGGRRRLRDDQYGAYAQYLNEFYEFMLNNGVDLYGISVQNEPDYAYEWTWWSAEEILRFLRDNAGTINTRVIAPESFQYRKDMSDPILNDSTALANLDILGAHLYGTQFSQFPYPLFEQRGAGKELWMTEVYYPNSSDSADLWPQALDVGEHMHRALVDGRFQAYVWWYIRRYYGPMDDNGRITKRGANMAHFARFVRPGYVRVQATAGPQQNVYVSAYKSDTGNIVIVAVNKGGQADLRFTLTSGSASRAAWWLTDGGRNLAPQAELNVSDGSFSAQLPGQSVTTFVTE